MTIRDVTIWRENLSLQRPYTIAGETVESSENIFITLTADDGTLGIGSASPSERVSNESLDDCEAALTKMQVLLLNEDLRHFAALRSRIMGHVTQTPAASAAADMALFDLYGRIHQVRIVDYLGACHTSLPTSVTIGIKDLHGVREDLERYLQQGFQCIKVKIGIDPEHDIEVVHQLREWGGRAFRIRVDANQGYTASQLKRFVDAVRDLDIELIEQPFSVPGWDAMRSLPERIRRACMADEDLQTAADAIELLRQPWPYGMWNIKLMKSGGITGGKLIADLGALHDIPLMWGCGDESTVSITAALHVAYASPNTRYLDLDGSFDLAHDVVTGGFEVRDGHMILTPAAGLGVQRIRS